MGSGVCWVNNPLVNKHQREKLEGILKGLPKSAQDEIYALARKQRGEAQKRRRSKARETIDGERVGGGKRRPDPLLDWVLRIVEKDYAHGAREESRDEVALREGVVVGLTRRRASVVVDGEEDEQDARLSAELAGRQQSGIAVGDRVVVGDIDAPGSDEAIEVVSVLPRRTKLARPDAHDPRVERVVAANVDVVVVVVSVVSPPLHPRLIDRYLVAIESGGAEALIAVNKVDLLRDEDREGELSKLDVYQEAGIGVVVCAADPESGEKDVRALREALKGKTCVFVGHSGVGKSSLTNALEPGLGLDTGGVRSQDNRGRHTTTSSSMHVIGEGADAIRVIDTPGVRYFGLAEMTADELRWMFPEFIEHARDCKFNDCSHEHEPGCGVKDAVDRGAIARVRYETYLRLLEELRSGGRPKDVSERIRPVRGDLDD